MNLCLFKKKLFPGIRFMKICLLVVAQTAQYSFGYVGK